MTKANIYTDSKIDWGQKYYAKTKVRLSTVKHKQLTR